MIESREGRTDPQPSASVLAQVERRYVFSLAPLVPSWIDSQHLTLLTLLWSGLVLLFGVLARTTASWLWASSAIIILQYITDALDGKVGRLRDTGAIRWGFYV